MRDVPQSTHHRVFKFELTLKGEEEEDVHLEAYVLVNTHSVSKFTSAYHTFQVHLSEAAKPV